MWSGVGLGLGRDIQQTECRILIDFALIDSLVGWDQGCIGWEYILGFWISGVGFRFRVQPFVIVAYTLQVTIP